MIKLAAFDIDNTLIDRKEEVLRPSVIETFIRLKKAGIKTVIATGRPYFIIQDEVFEKLNYDYIICGNGTKIVDYQKRILYRGPMEIEMAKHFIEDLNRYQIEMSLEYSNGIHNLNGFKDMENVNILATVDYDKEAPTTGMGIFRPGTVDIFVEKYPELEFIPAGIENHYDAVVRGENKRNAISILCDALNIMPEEVIAVGDGINDLTMLEFAGIGVAMGNACAELKEAADYVTSSVVEDGVLKALEHFHII